MGRRQGRFNKIWDLRKGCRIVRWVDILRINFSEACGFYFALLKIHSSEYDCHLFGEEKEEKEIDRSTE